jgi:hypothetical protein
MPVQDQAVWRQVTVVTGGQNHVYNRGDLLPAPASERENSLRTLLRLGGALRVVEVVFTPDELAARASRPGQGPAATNTNAGVTATVVPPATADPRVATVGAPLVLGPKPAAHATKKDWKEYATEHGMNADEAESMTRDALAEHYRDA